LWQPATTFDAFEQHCAVVKFEQQAAFAVFVVTFFIQITSLIAFISQL